MYQLITNSGGDIMSILSKVLKDAKNLIGKNIRIEGKSYHVAGADKNRGLSGWFDQGNGTRLGKHFSINDLQKIK